MPKGNSLIAALGEVASLQVARNEVKERVVRRLEHYKLMREHFDSQMTECVSGSEVAKGWAIKANRADINAMGLESILNRETIIIKGDDILINLKSHIIIMKCTGGGLCYVASINEVNPRAKYKIGILPKLGQVFKTTSPHLVIKTHEYSLSKKEGFSFHWNVNDINDLESAKVFTVNVTGEWFEQIKSGEKTLEYRVIKPHWTNRLINARTGKNKPFDSLKIMWGYTSDPAKIITLPWRGFEILEGFVHPHFGNVPVDVYAIKLTEGVK